MEVINYLNTTLRVVFGGWLTCSLDRITLPFSNRGLRGQLRSRTGPRRPLRCCINLYFCRPQAPSWEHVKRPAYIALHLPALHKPLSCDSWMNTVANVVQSRVVAFLCWISSHPSNITSKKLSFVSNLCRCGFGINIIHYSDWPNSTWHLSREKIV